MPQQPTLFPLPFSRVIGESCNRGTYYSTIRFLNSQTTKRQTPQQPTLFPLPTTLFSGNRVIAEISSDPFSFSMAKHPLAGALGFARQQASLLARALGFAPAGKTKRQIPQQSTHLLFHYFYTPVFCSSFFGSIACHGR